MGPHSARCRPKAPSKSALPALLSVSGAVSGNSARYSPRTRGAAGRHSPARKTANGLVIPDSWLASGACLCALRCRLWCRRPTDASHCVCCRLPGYLLVD